MFCNFFPQIIQISRICNCCFDLCNTQIHIYTVLVVTLTRMSTFWGVVKPRQASAHELSAFHSLDYVKCLEKLSSNCNDEEMEETAGEYGLGMSEINNWYFTLCMVDVLRSALDLV